MTTVVNYIKQEVQDRNVSNSTMEAIMGMSHKTIQSGNKPSTGDEGTSGFPLGQHNLEKWEGIF